MDWKYRADGLRPTAGVAGILVGMTMVHSRAVNWLLDPIVALAFPSPKIAFLPIFVPWFGIESTSKILLVAFACVFPGRVLF